MNMLILAGIQIATSIWEVWMCYELLSLMVINKKYNTKINRIIIWCTIVFVGLGINRLNSFLSIPIFLLLNIIIIIVCIVLNRRKKVLRAGIFVLLIRCQYILDEMVSGGRRIRGISASFGLLAITIALVLLEVFILRYRYMKQEKDAIFLREQLLEERYSEMLETRQLVHDMKNHFLLLQKYEKEQRWEELHIYLEEIGGDLLEDSARVWSGNAIVDLMLNSKKIYAEDRSIKVEVNTEVIPQFPLDNREIISLFGNLLDNAIEACEKMKKNEKWIHIKIQKHHEVLCIEIENSIEEIPKVKKGELLSNKLTQRVHGLGLRNVRQIIDKHDGLYSYQIKENSFYTNITFFDEYIS